MENEAEPLAKENAKDKSLENFAAACAACISCFAMFFRTYVPDNVVRVQNKTSDTITFKCYSEDDSIMLIPQMEATLGPDKCHDFTSPATGERTFKVFVAKDGFAVGTYHTIEKGKLFQWSGSILSEAWI